ncbi:SDR family NAD(P)-dependent oxidoreductase [Frondihabitans cladoniiphilus]|uniref:Oxidoreductase n=1 Tax=Frondihabitans cladoniiphilus TaxID=715785 RepID=A0ABP8VUH2_9MICO
MAVWFVTGASRGFGASIVEEALARGHAVVATGRSVEALERRFADADRERLLTVPLDVTDAATVEAAVASAVDRFGRIDALVNNAGQGLVGAVEEVSDAETRSLMETNLFGVLGVTRAVLPVMREQGSGHVIMISSYGGFTQPGVGFGIYGASKFAMEGFSESLSHEVRELGIRVTVVEPGSFRTDFLESDSVRVAEGRIADYASLLDPLRSFVEGGSGTQPGDPAKAAAAILTFVESGAEAFRLPLGEDALAAVAAKLEQVAADLEVVRALGFTTDHD